MLREKYGFPLPESQVEFEKWNLGWKDLGPRPIERNSADDPSLISGRIMSALLQNAKNRIFIGSASGGIWRRSLAEGSLFSPRSDQAPNLSIGALAADPNNPQVLYAGTGEPGMSKDAFTGAGLLRSLDGGASWKRIDDGIFTGHRITNVWVDPGNSARLLVSLLSHPDNATIGFILESTDGGVQWQPLPAGGSGLSFAVSPGDPQRILASRSHPRGTTTADLLLSTDGGASFNAVNGPWTGTGKNVGRIDIAFSPSSPEVVWASIAPPLGPQGQDSHKDGIYRSGNGGASWKFVTASHHGIEPGNSIGWYSNPVAVTVEDPDTIYLGARFIHRYTLGGEIEQVTDDSGGGLPSIHVDQHVFVMDPQDTKTIYAGNDGGLFVTHDGGKSWSDMNGGLGITQFYYGCVGPDNGLQSLLGGSQDNGVCAPKSGQVWEERIFGDGMQCAVDPKQNNILYGTTQDSKYWLSTDTGQNFDLPALLPTLNIEFKAFFTPLAVDPSDPATLYGGAERVYRGTRNGSSISWEPRTQDIMYPHDPEGNPRTIRRLAVAATDPDVLYASGGNLLSRSTNGGSQWAAIDPPGMQLITDVAVHPEHKYWVYLTRSAFDGQQVLFAKDAGAPVAWKNFTKNLPNVPVNAIELFHSGSGIDARLDAYLATDGGVYYANLYSASGIQWDPVGTGLPNVHVYDVMLADNGQTLVAATHGRGMWCINTAQIVKPTYVIAGAESGDLPVVDPGETIRGFVLYTRPPRPGPPPVRIVSSNPAVLRVPATAKFKRGKVSAWFPITAGNVPRPTTATITATIGRVSHSFELTVTGKAAASRPRRKPDRPSQNIS